MRKLFCLILSFVCAVACLSLTACSNEPELPIEDAFAFPPAKDNDEYINKVIGSEKPTKNIIALYTTKQVIITKVTGIAYYDKSFYGETEMSYWDEEWTTTQFVENKTISIENTEPFSFSFEINSTTCPEYLGIILKTHSSVTGMFKFNTVSYFGISNLKIWYRIVE